MRIKYLHIVLTAMLGIYQIEASGAEASTGSSTTVTTTTADSAYFKRIEPSYTDFAGSRSNLQSLASGLRSGNSVTLTDTTGAPSVTFTPPTKPMGYGNVTRALDFANRDLVAAGITDPTPEQVSAALMGGTVINAQGQAINLDGVLQLRSQGMGWGQIAHQLNISPAASVHGQTATAVNVAGTSGTSTEHHSGIVNADGRSATGLTTASGKTVNAGGAKSNAAEHSGIVNADGSTAGGLSASGNAYGHVKPGIVSAGGTSAGFAGITTGGGAYNDGMAAVSTHSALGGNANGNAFGQSKGKN